MVYSGMGPDYRVLVTEARKAASVYEAKYGEAIPTEQLVIQLATVMQSYTQMGGVRPFGCSLLVIGVDQQAGPMLYQVRWLFGYKPSRLWIGGLSKVYSRTK